MGNPFAWTNGKIALCATGTYNMIAGIINMLMNIRGGRNGKNCKKKTQNFRDGRS